MRQAFTSITKRFYVLGGYDACSNELSTWESWRM
jgi:hypothetical protein